MFLGTFHNSDNKESPISLKAGVYADYGRLMDLLNGALNTKSMTIFRVDSVGVVRRNTAGPYMIGTFPNSWPERFRSLGLVVTKWH